MVFLSGNIFKLVMELTSLKIYQDKKIRWGFIQKFLQYFLISTAKVKLEEKKISTYSGILIVRQFFLQQKFSLEKLCPLLINFPKEFLRLSTENNKNLYF
jgi:hypothetical protein